MYLVTMKKHHLETPLDLCKDLQDAKSRKYQYTIGWSDQNPIHIYDVGNLKEIANGN